MDKRKLQELESSGSGVTPFANITVDDIINSRKVNRVLLDKVEELFELEFSLKQKA